MERTQERPAEAAIAIRIRDLRKVYRIGQEKVVALKKIDVDIRKGEICCILGTSGSGKSTLLNQLAGLEKPTWGSVTIFDRNISKMSESQLAVFRQKHIGFVFQSYDLISSMTALENVSMPLEFRGVSPAKRRRLAEKMLERVGLKDRMRHRPSEMSGGQQQRVGIARAFVMKPELVFADEPTGNLDSKTSAEVMSIMLGTCRENGSTMVLVTHDRNVAAYADRILTISDGEIVKEEFNPEPRGSEKNTAEPAPKAEPAPEKETTDEN